MMDRMHTTYQLAITTLTPLHIGTGRTLLQDYDFVIHRGRTWVVNEDALAQVVSERGEDFDRMVAGAPASDLLSSEDYVLDSPMFRYVMQGEPRSRTRGSEVQEQLKDVWDQPYIPGSSLKGALRTALATIGWLQRGLTFQPRDLNPNAKYAAQRLEAQVLFGEKGKPNDDVLRMLQIGDSSPDEGRNLQLVNVQVVAGKQLGSPIEMEAVASNITFMATLTLDGYLQREEVFRQLGWEQDQITWINHIPRVVNYVTQIRLEQEQMRWRERADAPNVRGFYSYLRQTLDGLKRNEFILQVGWGGGWDSKTFGRILTDNEQAFARIVEMYRQMDRKRSFRIGDRYPKSRRLIVQNGQPILPLGWIQVRMEAV